MKKFTTSPEGILLIFGIIFLVISLFDPTHQTESLFVSLAFTIYAIIICSVRYFVEFLYQRKKNKKKNS